MKKIGAILFVVAVLLFGAIWLVGYSETFESHFETYQQLKESELINKGWVPDFIPKSAYDIDETHTVDAGRVNVRFRFLPGDTKEIETVCTLASNNDANTRYYRCKYENDMVVVRIRADGQGEILSE
jgi:hypothetical protein